MNLGGTIVLTASTYVVQHEQWYFKLVLLL